jgi:hypothetical protein
MYHLRIVEISYYDCNVHFTQKALNAADIIYLIIFLFFHIQLSVILFYTVLSSFIMLMSVG